MRMAESLAANAGKFNGMNGRKFFDTDFTNFHEFNLCQSVQSVSKEGLIETGWQNKVANVKQNMPRYAQIIFIVCAVCFLEFVAFGVRPTNIKGLLLLPCGFLFFCICIFSLVTVFTKWRASRFWALASLAACLLLLPTSGFVGRLIRDELFKQRFSLYEALVQKIESGNIPISSEGQVVSTTNYDSSLAERVVAERETNGVLIVVFNYGGAGPPPYHVDYLYISSGVIDPGSYLDKRYPSQTKIKDKWFEVVN
jgi:hypothetical protein